MAFKHDVFKNKTIIITPTKDFYSMNLQVSGTFRLSPADYHLLISLAIFELASHGVVV